MVSRTKTVCVYCGASPLVEEKYKKAAVDVGTRLAEEGYNIVYGGGNSGMMGLVANTAMTNGTKVVGIIPDHIDSREVKNTNLTELHVVTSMHERKAMMANRSDVFLILPGGLGTMDEFFEIVTWKQLGLHDKTIIVYNFENYWENLRLLIENIARENFMKRTDRALFSFCNQLDDVIKIIECSHHSEKLVHDDVV